MKFHFTEYPELPRLSWCLTIQKDNPVIQVSHGSWMETGENYFVEGAWSGSFEERDFDHSFSLMGSGAIIRDSKLVVCTPCHTVECVYSLKVGHSLFISNSVVFILQANDDDLDHNYLDYESDILSISDGLSRYKKWIPTKKGNSICLHYFNNFSIDSALRITEEKIAEPPSFTEYKVYYDFLVGSLRGISSNLSSPNRKVHYSPIVFSSNGYDSSACAALGKEIGCSEAVVYESKRGYRSDSGKPVVLKLGYQIVHEKEELNYQMFNTAEEFVASGELGTSIFFAAAEKELEGKFLLSGTHGDKVWDKNGKWNTDILRSFFPDTAKKEFRLRVGYILIDIPFLGVMNHKDILTISKSEEMKPWSLFNDYDRPIPRRMVEEKGVPREMFGFHKDGGAGSSLRFLNLSYLKKVMPEGSYKDFELFYKNNKRLRKLSVRKTVRSIAYAIYCSDIVLKQKKMGVMDKLFKISKWDRKYKCSPWAPSFLFLWGVDKIRRKYEIATTKMVA